VVTRSWGHGDSASVIGARWVHVCGQVRVTLLLA